MECTARSASFLKSASSISFVKSPLPPTCARGTSVILSPVVFIFKSSTSMPGYFSQARLFTHSACQSASILPLVATVIFFKIFSLSYFQFIIFEYSKKLFSLPSAFSMRPILHLLHSLFQDQRAFAPPRYRSRSPHYGPLSLDA